MAASRAENWAFSAPGTLGNAANAIQGGERFQALTLTTPGTIQLSAVGIHVRYPNAGADDYVGHFLSSDEKLNKIWYQGAYTNDTNMVPIGAVPGSNTWHVRVLSSLLARVVLLAGTAPIGTMSVSLV